MKTVFKKILGVICVIPFAAIIISGIILFGGTLIFGIRKVIEESGGVHNCIRSMIITLLVFVLLFLIPVGLFHLAKFGVSLFRKKM